MNKQRHFTILNFLKNQYSYEFLSFLFVCVYVRLCAHMKLHSKSNKIYHSKTVLFLCGTSILPVVVWPIPQVSLCLRYESPNPCATGKQRDISDQQSQWCLSLWLLRNMWSAVTLPLLKQIPSNISVVIGAHAPTIWQECHSNINTNI